MGASLPHHKPLDGCFAAGAGKICAAKNLQLIFVAAATIGHRIKIGLTGSKRCAEVLQTPFQYPWDGQAQGLGLRFGQSGCQAAGVQSGLPQGFIDVNVAEAGDKCLVQQQGFQNSFAIL